MGTSRRIDTAIPMCLATMFVITLATVLTHNIHSYVLVPLGIEALKLIVFIVSIAAVVQITEIYIRYTSTFLHQILGVYLPLITSNCAVLAIVLTVVDLPFIEAIFVSLGSSIGFAAVLVIFSSLREKISEKDVPRAFQGVPVVLLTAGIFALAMSGFKGVF